jgi:hypothetical protein
MPERDLFANFDRMRREMDELFGDAFDRRLSPRRRGGFSPAVDVYYAGEKRASWPTSPESTPPRSTSRSAGGS